MNGWYEAAEASDEHAEVWDGYQPLPDPGVNDALDAFCAAKNITINSLVKVGTRLSAPTVLAFAYNGGIKFRDVESGQRWNYLGSEFPTLKVIRAGAKHSDTVIVCEGETDAARLTMLYPECDVAALPAGAKRFTGAMTNQLARYHRVLVGLDNDAAGDEGAAKIAAALPQALRFAPPDANDWCSLPPDAAPPELPEHHADTAGVLVFDDIMAAFDGELPPPVTIVDDLLYDQGIHLISGHPGSGKSIITMGIAHLAMSDERPVVWLDYEMGPRATGQRLREMGVARSTVAQCFHYKWDAPAKVEEHLGAVAERFPRTILVIDSLSKALSKAGKDENDANEVTAYMRQLIAVAKTHLLPIVLIDHVAKDAKGSRYSRGSGAKLADVDVHLSIDKIEDFNRNQMGAVEITVKKDREGYLPVRQYLRVGDGMGNLPLVPIAKDDLDAAADSDDAPSI